MAVRVDYPVTSLPALLSFLDEQSAPHVVIDAGFRIVAANRAYYEAFPRADSIEGMHCYEVSHHFDQPCDLSGEPCPLRMSQECGQTQRVLHLHHTSRGEEHVDVETTPIRDSNGAILYFVESLRVVRQVSGSPAAVGLVGRSACFKEMLSLALRVAPTNAAVLLHGETGTGKEMVARLLHETSLRSSGPFVPVDCSGMTESLFESELFGYEKGAFTGAQHRRAGLVEAARGGTLFLDEVGDIPHPLQVKLLRLLESGTYRRVGSVETLRADFRLVCATHRDLEAMVEEGAFRRDLFHRISTFPIHVPALVERLDDIPLLADSLLKRFSGDRKIRFSESAMAYLGTRRYPGNIRELRNIIERAVILADTDVIDERHCAKNATKPLARRATVDSDSLVISSPVSLDELEAAYLNWVSRNFPDGHAAMAKRLGVGPRTLYRKLAKTAVRRR